MPSSSFLDFDEYLVGATSQSINQTTDSGAMFVIASGFRGYSCSSTEDLVEQVSYDQRTYGCLGFTCEPCDDDMGISRLPLVIAFKTSIILYAFITQQSIY